LLDLLEEFRSILSALQAAEIEFAVCGGLAVAIHVHPRATLDIDLLMPRDQVDRAREVTRLLGYQIETGAMTVRRDVIEIFRLSKPDPETGDLLSLDLLVVTPELEPVWGTRQRVDWEHGSVPVVSREGLVTMKRLRGSGQDLDDIRMLEADDGSR
jgi:hypothetical protein